jgi:hypothetical protein
MLFTRWNEPQVEMRLGNDPLLQAKGVAIGGRFLS